MTVNDPMIHVSFGPSEVALVGTPEEYAIRSNNEEFTRWVRYVAKHPTLVEYGNKPMNKYYTGNSTMEELFLSVVSVIPGQATVLKAPEGLAEKFWDKVETNQIEVVTGDNFIESL